MEVITARASESNLQPAAGSLPNGFDPVASPIIAQHWFGWRPLGAVAADVVQDLTFRRKVQRLHAKGARLVGKQLAELGTERCLTSIIEAKLDRFLSVPDEALDAMGGHDFPPVPIHEALE